MIKKLKKPIKLKVDGKTITIKSIESAPDEKVYRHIKLVKQFMKKIFGLTSYMITDLSSVHDFDFRFTKSGVRHSTQKYLDKIKKIYGIDVSKVKGLLLHKIFDKIQRSLES